MPGPTDEEIKAVFETFDADNSGHIDSKEIKKVCEQLGVDASAADIDALISQADSDGDGKVSLEEFKKAVQ